jgi:DNA primase
MDFAHLTTQERTVSSGPMFDAKEQVKQAIDIVELVGKYVQLRRQGRNYVALCPWHDDSRPSLQVNPERQSWKCWVCDVGGDVFSFIMQMDGVTFPEALSMLADQAGISIKPTKFGGSAAGGFPPSGQDKRNLYQVAAWAEKQYHDCLLHDADAEPARKYLRERQITAESIEKFHLGFSPNGWDWILRRAQAAGIGVKSLEAVGLLAQSGDGRSVYDRFRGRVLFSIRDTQSRPIALGGRVLPESGNTSPAKYLNSPETPIFKKSDQLYGLDLARESLRKPETGAIIMEGYTDVIVAHQCGFTNAVAALGTAVGPRHVQILKRFTDRIYLLLDGDEAGQKRTNEVLELFVAGGVDLRVAVLPDDLDPCDFLLQRGADAFRQILEGAVDALEHAFRTATRGIDLVGDVHRASQALERLVAIMAKAPRLRPDASGDDRFREEKMLQRLAASFHMPEQGIRERLSELRRGGQRPSARLPLQREGKFATAHGPHAPAAARADEAPHVEEVPMETGPVEPWQRELLEIVVRYPDCVARARLVVRPDQLPSTRCRKILETLYRLFDEGNQPTFDRAMLVLDEEGVKSLLVELDESGSAKKIADPGALLEDWIKDFERREAERQDPVITGLLRDDKLDDSQKNDVLLQLIQQRKTRQGISGPTDG